MTMPELPLSMRAAVIRSPGGPEVLEIQTRPVPVASDGEILVRVTNSALNRADLVQRAGRYPAPPGVAPDIPGLEYAGRVAAIGPGVTGWQVGDRVFGLVPGAAHADYLVTDGATAIRIPEQLDNVQAGVTAEAFITAHDALRQAEFRAGESVLIHAVGSGVGLAAVQLVRALGGTPYGTARSESKLAPARALGMEAGVVPTRTEHGAPQFNQGILDATEGRGVDVILDLVGGHYVTEGVRALAPGGRLVLIGLLAGPSATLDLRLILTRRLKLRGTVLRSRTLAERREYTAAFQREVLPLLASGAVRAVIDHILPLTEVAAGHTLLASNEVVGKVALVIEEA